MVNRNLMNSMFVHLGLPSFRLHQKQIWHIHNVFNIDFTAHHPSPSSCFAFVLLLLLVKLMEMIWKEIRVKNVQLNFYWNISSIDQRISLVSRSMSMKEKWLIQVFVSIVVEKKLKTHKRRNKIFIYHFVNSLIEKWEKIFPLLMISLFNNSFVILVKEMIINMRINTISDLTLTTN